MIWIVLAVLFAILALYFHSSTNKMDNNTDSFPIPMVTTPK